jgi:peptidoglycan/xylan/chitin deacetylase (PgdA/CDA1 family)
MRSYLSKQLYRVNAYPRVFPDAIDDKKKFPFPYKGAVIITADFELAWAVQFSKRNVDPIAIANRERKNVRTVLRLLDKYNIPVVWATVGHLFLDKCSKGDHDWMMQLPHFNDHWDFSSGDWFQNDPYSSWQDDANWYAPDLVKEILSSETMHEIGCHTFSHIDCSDRFCPSQVMEDEMIAFTEAAARWGIEAESMAFPAGSAGNYPTIKRYGIKIYRKRVKPYELAYPFRDEHGLLCSATGPMITRSYSDWTLEDTLMKYRRSIEKAVKTGTVAHLWFHPSDDSYIFERIFPEILKLICEFRDRGLLWVTTMKEIARHINNYGVV